MMNKKKWMLGATMALALMGMSSLSWAGSYTRYCLVTGMSEQTTNVATWFRMTVERLEDACGLGCKVEWSGYLKANYADYYELAENVNQYKTAREVKEAFYDDKAFARKMEQPFHHATDFSCSGD